MGEIEEEIAYLRRSADDLERQGDLAFAAGDVRTASMMQRACNAERAKANDLERQMPDLVREPRS